MLLTLIQLARVGLQEENLLHVRNDSFVAGIHKLEVNTLLSSYHLIFSPIDVLVYS